LSLLLKQIETLNFQIFKFENGPPNGPPVCYLKYALVQTGTENWYRMPMRGFNFVPIQPDPMLIFLIGHRLNVVLNRLVSMFACCGMADATQYSRIYTANSKKVVLQKS
jgi:hypothetical protein